MKIKKFLIFILLLFIAPQSHSEADGPDFWAINSKNAVKMYDTSGKKAKQIATIPSDTFGLKNYGCVGIYSYEEFIKLQDKNKKIRKKKYRCKVQYKGTIGWIDGAKLKENASKKSPSFDCTKTNSSIEQMICTDSELTDLDIKMSETFKKALIVAKKINDKKSVNLLKTIQRGWIKERNECWKSQSITAKDCVINSYKLRISKLESTWGLEESEKSINFKCNENAEFFFTAYKTKLLPSAIVEYGDKSTSVSILPENLSTKNNSKRYDGEFGMYVIIDENNAILKWDSYTDELRCTKN